MPELSKSSLALKRLRERTGLSVREVAAAIGKPHTTYSHYESSAYKKPFLPGELVEALIPVFEARGVAPRELRALAGPMETAEAESSTSTAPPKGEIDMSRRVPIELGARDLPVYGSIKGGFEGEVVDVQHPVDWTFRPPALVGVDGAFALYVIGDSMEPRYEHGEMVLVHPGRPVRRGNYVAVEFRNQSATVKRFLRLNDHFLELEQLNPPKTLRFPRSDIARVLRIIGTIEER